MSKCLYVKSEKKKKKGTNKLIYKRENRITDIEGKKLMITKGEVREAINWEIGIDICTLLLLLLSHFSHGRLWVTP